MARSVDNVDTVITPFAGSGSGSDGDAPLTLLLHPIHGGIAIMDFAHPVQSARVIEDPLGRRRLARVDVGGDTDIPRILDAMLSGQL
jgi:hypothetical protein